MSVEVVTPGRGGLWSSVASLFAASSTLVCCAIPALLVSIGAGAALSSLISVFPQVVWLSEHKIALFVIAGAMMLTSAALRWRNRNEPCPVDPALRDACVRTRKVSGAVFYASVALYLIGAWFAFVLPWLNE